MAFPKGHDESRYKSMNKHHKYDRLCGKHFSCVSRKKAIRKLEKQAFSSSCYAGLDSLEVVELFLFLLRLVFVRMQSMKANNDTAVFISGRTQTWQTCLLFYFCLFLVHTSLRLHVEGTTKYEIVKYVCIHVEKYDECCSILKFPKSIERGER